MYYIVQNESFWKRESWDKYRGKMNIFFDLIVIYMYVLFSEVLVCINIS